MQIEKLVVSEENQRFSHFKAVYGCSNEKVIFFTREEKPWMQGEKTFWSFGEEVLFEGTKSNLTKEESAEIAEFLHFLEVFEAYEYTLNTRANFDLIVEGMIAIPSDEGYSDYDYTTEVTLSSQRSQWGSESMVEIECYFAGHITTGGGNQILNPLYMEEKEKYRIKMELRATEESMKNRINTPLKHKVVIDSKNHIAVAWFVLVVLPLYYMKATIAGKRPAWFNE